MKNEAEIKALKTVPREKAFYFFTSIGNYTGENASSLREFMEKIKIVDAKSLEFHLYRGDFEKWTAEVLENTRLAEDIKRLKNASLTGESLRNQLYATVAKELKRLTNLILTSE
ncbi:MAG: DUF5752 family protein [Nitrososphaerota archaeon]|nr:DUF5752 family protein [Nitrososphaerota archaeon]